jgi:hypothetical protein
MFENLLSSGTRERNGWWSGGGDDYDDDEGTLRRLGRKVTGRESAAAAAERAYYRSREKGVAGARALGWVSLAIAAAELLAPRKVEGMLGISKHPENTGILRVLGVRELGHGIDLLAHDDPAPGVWSRVAGDMLDGVLLAAAAKRTRRPGSFGAVTAMVLGVAAADVIVAGRLSAKR